MTFHSGAGAWLYTDDDVEYLDCVSGIATNGLGHAHPLLIDALAEQAEKLWHLSNMFRVPGQETLAAKLTAATFADVVFFSNSGSEAVECALKTARRYHAQNDAPQRIEIIGLAGSFHGRTYGAINASGNPAYLDGFGPRLPGFVQCNVDDLEGLEAAIYAPNAAALIVEPVQGEGGARALSGEILRRLRNWCTDAGVLLIYDEIQSGMGRTGKLFAHQWFDGCEPDIMAIAKALGGGFPVGACLATRRVAAGMTFGTHGSTFGGNPLAMAVANAAFDLLADERLLENARGVAERLSGGLCMIADRYPRIIAEIRGKGLLIGIKMIPNNREFIEAAHNQRLLLAGGGDNCVRLLPPLNLAESEADDVLRRFESACATFGQSAARAA
jgi:acetylornithine/N-succinyldiaminopimelate aminotransferase